MSADRWWARGRCPSTAEAAATQQRQQQGQQQGQQQKQQGELHLLPLSTYSGWGALPQGGGGGAE
ncbi:hypothetical protein KPATCC21470_2145 [Kitasatospora purpeofusca]